MYEALVACFWPAIQNFISGKSSPDQIKPVKPPDAGKKDEPDKTKDAGKAPQAAEATAAAAERAAMNGESLEDVKKAVNRIMRRLSINERTIRSAEKRRLRRSRTLLTRGTQMIHSRTLLTCQTKPEPGPMPSGGPRGRP